MVTNINLVSQESESKSMLTGKAALVSSVALVFVSLVVYGVISYMGNNYAKQRAGQESAIQSEKTKMSGPNYAVLADFQGRVDVLGKIIDDHPNYEDYVKEFSKFVLPEMKLTSFSCDKEDNLSISGETTNYEALSRGMLLLQQFPGISSVEFKSSGEKSLADGGQAGLTFELAAKINKSLLKNISAGANSTSTK